MSYDKFKKTEGEFTDVFTKSKTSFLREFKNKNLNLFLCSSSFTTSMEPFLEKALGDKIDNAKVLLISNAGIGHERMEMVYQYLNEFTTVHNTYLKHLDITRFPKNIILEAINSCDIISFSGGLVSRLITAIDNAGIRKELLEVLNSGKPFIGFSSGSMIMSNSTVFAQHYIGEADPEIEGLQPLGLVDFEMYPHINDNQLAEVKILAQNINEAYGLKNHEGLIVTEGELIQIGNPTKLK